RHRRHRVDRARHAVHRDRADRCGAIRAGQDPGLRPVDQDQPEVTGGDPREARDGDIPGAGVLGMWIFLATLGVLFVAAIVGYLVVRLKATDWPPPGMPRLPAGL